MKPIGISGYARVGKDTLFNLLQRCAKEQGINVQRVGLADYLKEDLKSFIKDHFNYDIYNINDSQKELIRPLLVAYGKCKRSQTEGKYWTSKVQSKVEDCIKNNIIPIITDVRYMEYPEDEFFWLKQKNNGILIYLSRLNVKPANIEEKINVNLIRKHSDYSIYWKTENSDYYDILYKKYYKKIKDIINHAK
jgi:hypothetical protein